MMLNISYLPVLSFLTVGKVLQVSVEIQGNLGARGVRVLSEFGVRSR